MSIAALYVKVHAFTDMLAAFRASAFVFSLHGRLWRIEGKELPINIVHENSPKEERASFPALSIA
jgi:hypothetical protein